MPTWEVSGCKCLTSYVMLWLLRLSLLPHLVFFSLNWHFSCVAVAHYCCSLPPPTGSGTADHNQVTLLLHFFFILIFLFVSFCKVLLDCTHFMLLLLSLAGRYIKHKGTGDQIILVQLLKVRCLDHFCFSAILFFSEILNFSISAQVVFSSTFLFFFCFSDDNVNGIAYDDNGFSNDAPHLSINVDEPYRGSGHTIHANIASEYQLSVCSWVN